MEQKGLQVIPGEFNAAGLIVPDPSINSFPMPLRGLETGGVVWYMAAGQRELYVRPPGGRFGAALPDPPGCRAHQACCLHPYQTDGCVACDAATGKWSMDCTALRSTFGLRWLAAEGVR